MNRVTFLILTIVFLIAATWQIDAENSDSQSSGSMGLVLVDIQNFYFPGGRIPLVGAEAAAGQARRILLKFREMGWPVIHVRHISKGIAESAEKPDHEWQIHELVNPVNGEHVITKHHVNGFRDTRLDDILKSAGIRHLVVCGMQTHMCLEAAVRAAVDRGYRVTVVGNACATRDLVFENTSIPARLVHASTLATLKSGYATVVAADVLLKESP
jgi:nicotinamidase-related amidase